MCEKQAWEKIFQNLLYIHIEATQKCETEGG